MAPKSNSKTTVPDYKNIPHSHRLPVTHREVQRTFGKLSRHSLISLAQQWLAKKNRDFCRPYLLSDRDDDDEEEEDEQYTPAQSCEELQEIYKELAARKGGKREIQDRILEGDWRKGISMYQLATAEIQYLLDHPNSLRWTAKRLARIPNAKSAVLDMEVTNDSEHLPRFQAQTFMSNLSRELTPLMKAHYLLTKIKTLPMTILRVYIHDSPYSTEASLATDNSSPDSAKSVFFIWPNGSPFVYSSIANHLGQVISDDGRHLRDIVQQAIPKAFSRPSARYQLASTNFTTKSLDALLTYRGPGKSNAAAGGWSVFQDHSFSQNALDFITSQRGDAHEKKGADQETSAGATKQGPGRPKRTLEDTETSEAKRRREVAEGRFGTSAKPNDGRGLERFEVRIDDSFPQSRTSADGNNDVDTSDLSARPSNHNRRGRPSLLDRSLEEIEELGDSESWVPDVRAVFQGSHVFAGIRQLVEQGVVDGEKMPGWMTGEAGVTIGAVKEGRIRTKKGTVPGV
ncbi:CHL4-domain-containing protein [Lentithecium fluviatile CBS 122367]|uniref:CHL4-domain-containing protein n=1 Tax=Lentithecium fluviatile CBS 122367 TaxID=1168545 RepID=A0A6G1JKA7_9PLEO|nr:CHL4-domain-containing protein [Lentithecium fluviatile CBS 122367]